MPARTWTDDKLRQVAAEARSVRQVITLLGLIPAGGNYIQVNRRIEELHISTKHFDGRMWRKGLKIPRTPVYALSEILVANSKYTNIHKLKKRLFAEGLKSPACEECGWNTIRPDGIIPVELDHRNGNHFDHRIENLRILCPNCHSLKPTHRGKNKKRRGGGIGRHGGLKHL